VPVPDVRPEALAAAVHAAGPLSRNGYFLLDDSGTAVWDAASRWVKPRAEKGAQDWYFFLYEKQVSLL
jgi:hypothetical protein